MPRLRGCAAAAAPTQAHQKQPLPRWEATTEVVGNVQIPAASRERKRTERAWSARLFI